MGIGVLVGVWVGGTAVIDAVGIIVAAAMAGCGVGGLGRIASVGTRVGSGSVAKINGDVN